MWRNHTHISCNRFYDDRGDFFAVLFKRIFGSIKIIIWNGNRIFCNPSGTPGLSGKPNVQRQNPLLLKMNRHGHDRNLQISRFYYGLYMPRASLKALIVASVPEDTIRIISIEGTRSMTSLASLFSISVEVPKLVPDSATFFNDSTTSSLV